MLSEPIEITLKVVEVLEALNVPYLIGGSIASSLYGTYRATADSDLVADLKSEHVERFAQSLQSEFYLDVDTIRDALQHRSSFSLIHFKTTFKVDVFIPKQRTYSRIQLERRIKLPISNDPENLAYVATAEDSILAKLEWYRMGNEVSDQQWRDIISVLKAQGDRLDRAYLREWANVLKVADLLEKALIEANE
jgi:hypothetical protein